MHVGSLRFEPPAPFACDEQMLSFIAPAPPEAAGRTSLLVRQKDVPAGAHLARLAGEALADLAQSVKGISHISKAEIAFDDGQPGMLFAYEFAARGHTVLRQFYALRLDGEKLTSITLTADKASLDDATASSFLDAIASLQLDPGALS